MSLITLTYCLTFLLIVLQAFDGLAQGLEQIPVGFSVNAFDGFEKKRQELFGGMLQRMSVNK